MFSDTCADQIAVFNYFQFNVRSSATIFITRTLVKLRQIFTAFAVSLSGQKIKFLIIIIPVIFFHESVLTSSESCAPRSKIN